MNIFILLGYILISWGCFIILIGIIYFINKLYNKNKKFVLYNENPNKDKNYKWDLFEYTIYILKYEYPQHKTCNLKIDLSENDKFVPNYYDDYTKKIIYDKIEKFYNQISPSILDKIYNINNKYNSHYDLHIKKALMLHCFHIAYKYNLNFGELIKNIDNIFNDIDLNHFTIFYMFNFSNILYNHFWTIPKNDDGWNNIYLNI